MVVSTFQVIVSTQEQYSVWPSGADLPLGWELGEITEGTLEACLAYIGEIWQAEAPDAVADEGKDFVVIIDDHDILAVTRADAEPPEGWQPATEALALSDALAFIGEAWHGAGPLPEQFRPGTGE